MQDLKIVSIPRLPPLPSQFMPGDPRKVEGWDKSCTPIVLGAFLFCMLCLGAAPATDERSPMSVDELEKQILAARRTVKSGSFAVQVKSTRNDLDYSFWLSQDGRLRQERHIRGEFQVSIFSNDFAYYYSSKPGRFENPDLIQRPLIERIPVSQAKPDQLPHLICNPLVAMFAPLEYTLFPKYSLESLISAGGREGITIRQTTWNGLPAFTVAFTLSKTGDKYEYDVVPGRDFNIVNWRATGTIHSTSGDQVYERTVSCELAQLPKAIWFPVHLSLKTMWNKKPTDEEDVVITAQQINEVIPDKVFSLAWDNLPSKQMVIQHSIYGDATTRPAPQPALIWDAGHLRPMTARDEADRRLSSQPAAVAKPPMLSSGQKWSASTLAVVAALTIALWFLQRRSRPI